MHGETIDVQTPDGTADCYLTRPSDTDPKGAVLFLIDAIGLRPRIEEMADRIASDGYVVLAPNVFYRAGRAPLWETPNFADAESRAKFMEALGPLMGRAHPRSDRRGFERLPGGARRAQRGSRRRHRLLHGWPCWAGQSRPRTPTGSPRSVAFTPADWSPTGTTLYEGAAHGYTMSDMAVFDEAACERHFQALGALLDRALK